MRSLAGAAVVLLTACSTALAPAGTGHSGHGLHTGVVVDGSRAEAQAYVRHLMAELSLPDGVTPELTEAMRALQAAAPVPEMLLDPGNARRLLQALAQGPATAGKLVALLAPDLQPAGRRTLVWLAKTAMLQWR